MSHPLLDQVAIDCTPIDYLRQVGSVFTKFGDNTQDSGNVSYGVKIHKKRYFVKTAGDPQDPQPVLNHAQRVGLLRNAVRLTQSCRHPALPQLYQVIESPVGPMLVYEWLEGELLRVSQELRDHPQSSFQRFLQLPPGQIQKSLEAVFELHRDLSNLGWVAVDFYDGCMIYDFSSGRLRIVDLDMYRDGPFTNNMGRMFGSSRFMAPEEFKLGEVIDGRTTVYVMGRTAVVFLANGTLVREQFRGPSALYEVVARACQTDPNERFNTVAAFYDAWRAARTA